ncbi:MAG: hypothetical protein Q3979_09580 [Actinomycetaceae bacterium]|nr:hypothetical protein [Actinomycetaceae bacterium]
MLFLAGSAIEDLRVNVRHGRGRRKWAESNGYEFVKKDKQLGRELGTVFGLDRSAGTHDRGSLFSARDVMVFPAAHGECRYGLLKWVEFDGDDGRIRYCAFVKYRMRGGLPKLRMKPEAKIGPKYADITTEWDDFNRQWNIWAEDREFALAFLSPVMQRFMMDHMRGCELRIDGAHAYLKLHVYVSEHAPLFRNLMDGWEACVVPFLWEQGSSL